ncbi:hypothetical protein N0V85_003271 [Neurospora sp. IMI 360204]|nr:hypothetical protein N0V85_003271 [Neurospora sp. IMI 360204]
MASVITATPSTEASEDSVSVTGPSQIVPLTDSASEHPLSDPDLSLIKPPTENTSEDSAIPTNVSPAMQPVDASNVPLPDDACDEDMLEISPLDDHEKSTTGSDDVELSNNEPEDMDITDRAQDDTIPDDTNSHDTTLTSPSSSPSSPQTPKRQDKSSSDSGDHDSTTSSLSSIDSSPKTPAKESSSRDPFVLEDPTKSLSLNNLDLNSPNWMDNIANFLENLQDLEPDTEETQEKLKSGAKAVEEEEGEYDGPVIALPDTPEYQAFSNNFQIRLSKFGGFGTFATRDLKIGEVILIEKPLLKTTHVDFYSDFGKLTEEDQAKFVQLYTPPGDYLSRDGSDYNHIRAILKANSFAIPPYDWRIIGVYNVASRLNHACLWIANVDYTFDAKNSDAITLTIGRLVKAGSELFISYGGSPLSLYERYGFRCCCGGCEGVSDQDVTIMKKIKNGEISVWG